MVMFSPSIFQLLAPVGSGDGLPMLRSADAAILSQQESIACFGAMSVGRGMRKR